MRLAMCFPNVDWLDHLFGDDKANAAFIQQKYIVSGLTRLHNISCFAPINMHQVLYQTSASHRSIVFQTWSAKSWYRIMHKVIWRFQKLMGMPYLNVFSNLSRFDAFLRILPGHDVIYERNDLYNASVAMACKKLQLPYVIFFDADQLLEHEFMDRPIKGLLRWRAERILRYNFSVARCIISVSESAKRQLVKLRGVPEEKIVVFPNGVDVNSFKPLPIDRIRFRSEIGLEDKHYIFIFVGNFYKWHDVPTLLKAFNLVLTEYPLARLLLVGSGSQLLSMKTFADELNISNAVKFTGQVHHKEIPRLIGASDTAVAPVPEMDRDSWLSPMKLFEYMASEVAIIASNAGQINEVIEHNRNGLLVTPGNPLELAGAMKRLIEDPTLRMQLSHRAREDAVKNYAWERYISRMDNLFYSIVKEKQIA